MIAEGINDSLCTSYFSGGIEHGVQRTTGSGTNRGNAQTEMPEPGRSRGNDAHLRDDPVAAREWSSADYAGKGSEDGEHLRLHRRRLGA